MVKILDGKRVAAKLEKNLARKFGHRTGSLAAVLVGKNPASILYLKKEGSDGEKIRREI